MTLVDDEKLDGILGIERDSTKTLPAIVQKNEVEVVDEEEHLPEEVPGTALDLSEIPIDDDKALEKFVREKASENIETASAILKHLQSSLEGGLLSEEMYEAAASLVSAISTSIDQVGKLKRDKDNFKLRRAKLAIDKARLDLRRKEADKPKAPREGNKTLIVTREDLMREIAERNL